MNRRITLALVALCTAIAAIAALTPTIIAARSITITAQFDDAAGLYTGNSVSVLGMPVGKVTAITTTPAYVEVVFTLDKGVKVPADVQAVTVSTSILTDRHIELTPPYSQGNVLKDGDLIGLGRTKSPVQFDRVLKMVDRLAAALAGNGKSDGAVARLIDVGAQVGDNSAQIKSALDQLSQAMRLSANGGSNTKDNVTQVIRALDELTHAGAENDSKIRLFGTTLRKMSQILADESIGSGTTGRQANQLLIQATDLLDKNRDNINQAVRNGTTITGTLVDKRREISEIFDVLPLLTENVYNAIDPVNKVFRGHMLADKVVFDSQFGKEICNLMGLRQLGCSTGTLQDYGPDFGLTSMLDGMTRMGQK